MPMMSAAAATHLHVYYQTTMAPNMRNPSNSTKYGKASATKKGEASVSKAKTEEE